MSTLTRYLILSRAEGHPGPRPAAFSMDSMNFKGTHAATEPILPKASFAELTRDEAADAQRDDNVMSLIPPMPVTLIRPVVDVQNGALSDERDDATWGLEAVGALESTCDGAGVRVAVLDTGLDLDHPAFKHLRGAGAIKVRNFTNGSDGDVSDHDGHGTHCAATICGGVVDGVRLGVAPNVKSLLVGKVLGPGDGAGTVANALLWAAGEGVDVVSMSLGIDFPGWANYLVEDQGVSLRQATSMALDDYLHVVDAYREVSEALGVYRAIVVAATGNESDRPRYTINVAPPAAAKGILAVGALERRAEGFAVARFSNTRPDLVAPGVNIRSARAGGGLESMSGTSMATPHVAGVAALWHQQLRQQHGQVTPETLLAKLRGTASHAGLRASSRSWKDVGNGLVKAPVSS
jgi:hypothetical protein